MNDHTPGPWKAIYVGCSDWDLSGPVTEQDWKLAAAAPDLLEALKQCQAALEALWQPADSIYQRAADAADRAIAKATGGQP